MASKHERNTVNRLVHAIKMGWIDLDAKRKKEEEEQKKLDQQFDDQEFIKDLEQVQDIWTQDPPKLSGLDPLIAPTFEFPDHIDSFNPAPEFLEDPRQRKKN
jgi:hypothetical protein